MTGFSFEQVGSSSELKERLRRSQRSVLLGGDDEAPRNFFVASYSGGAIGICSQGHGIQPSSLIDESAGEAWIGYNSKVANVDLTSCRARFEHALDGVFYSIVAQMQDGSVVVVYELGACRVSRSGQLLWNRTTDVVTEFWDDADALCLRTDDEAIRIDKQYGKKLPA